MKSEAFEILLLNEDEMIKFGHRLARLTKDKILIYLSGELGAGKTTLTRGLLRGLGYRGHVTSPTYTLVEPYDINGKTVYHFDLYRINHPQELEMIGLYEYLNEPAISIIEWPERGINVLPKPDLTLTLAIQKQGRYLTVNAKTNTGQKIVECLWND